MRCERYLRWVRRQPSAISGRPADDAHHIIGHGMGGMGMRASDLLTLPLTRDEHMALHQHGWRAWEERHGSQWMHVALTLARYIEEHQR